ncbi:MAG: hypothetical protein J6L66_02985 [Anaerotignum sp.]|nr:hypothetical protein [Anaerotignum sp.]
MASQQLPFIPETITVHLGLPDQPAENVTVSFPDYIKNVASSEIYATWPESAITANVLVIMSFTLNRVYTEHYRNRGYDFTITSSTAFDHKWIYGRNIFDSISVIVDEISMIMWCGRGASTPTSPPTATAPPPSAQGFPNGGQCPLPIRD